MTLRIEALEVRPLQIPLREPFVIATGRMDATRSVEIRVKVSANGREVWGMGEAAALPPVTREDEDDVFRAVEAARARLVGKEIAIGTAALDEELDGLFPNAPVARSGVDVALLDAAAHMSGIPLRAMLGGSRGEATRELLTDITIAIAEPEPMANAARLFRAQGFTIFKVKVGKDVDHDVRALAAVHDAVPEARLRIDANGGFTAKNAILLARELAKIPVAIECYEQPCAAHDLDGLAAVAASVGIPVVADESVTTMADLAPLAQRKAAQGVNLKIAKSGGLLRARAIGLEARRRGMSLMVGGMVETRLGMTAGAHLAASLGGVDYVDLDTAWLLRSDPYEGGYCEDGPRYILANAPGLDVRPRT
jgi:L-Ala-D/L-Glu epimerase